MRIGLPEQGEYAYMATLEAINMACLDEDFRINNEVGINENKPEIIKIKKSNYYLIDTKLYKIKKDKTQGEYYSDYINGEIILINNTKPK